jgi:hypothetical protein
MNPDLAGFIQSGIGTIFVSAAAAKLLNRDSLRPFLLATGFSSRTSNSVSRIVPPLEAFLGASLLLGLAFPAAVAVVILSLSFGAVLVFARHKNVGEGCRCFGPLDPNRLSLFPVARTGLLAVAALLLGLLHLQEGLAVWHAPWQGSDIIAVAPGVLTGIGYVVAFSLLEQAWFFERRRPRPVPAVRDEVS